MSSLSTFDADEEDKREFEAAMQAFRIKTQSTIDRGIKWMTEEEVKELQECTDREMKLKIRERVMERVISSLGPRIYHEAPNDIMELIVSMFSADGTGGMNVLRLVSKRLKLVVESCATRLTNTRKEDGPDSLPLLVLSRCRRIEHIRYDSRNLRSLRGCPDRLKTLHICNGQHIDGLEPLRGCVDLEVLRIEGQSRISDLSPLEGCTRLNSLVLLMSCVEDISAVASMPLLRALSLMKLNQPSIKDLSPLAQCTRLRFLLLFGNTDLEDLSPLAGISDLQMLEIGNTQVADLRFLSALSDLNQFGCRMISLTTSLLPLERCRSLKTITCNSNARDLAVLQERMPHVEYDIDQ